MRLIQALENLALKQVKCLLGFFIYKEFSDEWRIDEVKFIKYILELKFLQLQSINWKNVKF